MARVVRTMMADDDGKPLVGAKANQLGVRTDGPHRDVDVFDGNVKCVPRGMSVAPRPEDLPRFLIPRRLADRYPGATGSNVNRFVFSFGSGSFEDGAMETADTQFEKLQLRVTSKTHGVVVPAETMPLEQFQNELANTRDNWEALE